MKLHTVIITHNRLELTKQVVESYLATVSLPHTLVVVDNASTDGTREWLLHDFDYGIHLLNENLYPGRACNIGFSVAPPDATLLHRQDNDFAFVEGWDLQVVKAFEKPTLGQLGLRTNAEEDGKGNGRWNVGGCCVIRRELWDKGLRYDERPWGEYPPGFSEDSFLSPAVTEMGYKWTRVREPCLTSLASGDWNDEYYEKSYRIRGIEPAPGDPTVPS